MAAKKSAAKSSGNKTSSKKSSTKTPTASTSSAKKSASKKSTSKRTMIEPHAGDKRYVRRDAEGHFTEKQVDVGRSLAADRRSTSTKTAKPGQGDRGDRKPAKKK